MSWSLRPRGLEGLMIPEARRAVDMNEPVVVDGVRIQPGDVGYADADGVIVLPGEDCLAILDRAEEIKKNREQLYGEKAGAA